MHGRVSQQELCQEAQIWFVWIVIHNDRQPFMTDNDSASMGLRNSKSRVVSSFGFCVLLTWPVIQTGGSVERKRGVQKRIKGLPLLSVR